MEKVEYVLTSCMIMVEDVSMNSYGLVCMKDDEIQKRIDDISLEKEKIERAALAFNKYQLSPEHFEDAVDDIIADT